MPDQMSPQFRQAAQPIIQDADDDEIQALLGALEAVDERTTIIELLTDFFERLGNSTQGAAKLAQQVIIAGPLDFKSKLN